MGHNSRLLRCRVAQLIIRCGQHSLQVFCLGIVLSVLGSILLTFRDDILMQLAIDFGGIVLMIGIAALLTWYKASNATHADAVVAASGNFETRRRNVVGDRASRDRLGPEPRTDVGTIEARADGGEVAFPPLPYGLISKK